MNRAISGKPSAAFVGASWTALMLGALAYLIGLWNASMQLNEKGYYLTLLLYGLFAAVSVQKAVRDRMEGVPVTNIYYGLACVSVVSALLLLFIGLWNAQISFSEKGFYGMAYALSLFAAIAVQKNTRDSGAGMGSGDELE
ncbi:inner membrane protein YiaA [Lysobacter sp. TAB13]|uniref:inner membrane protein YiaA n=1 Tax=Lysobacter sp. TAB13 TaxID=3233065 RepID=UPI003F972910